MTAELLGFYVGILLAMTGAALGRNAPSAAVSRLMSGAAFLSTLMVVTAFFRLGWVHGLGGLLMAITGGATLQMLIQRLGYPRILPPLLATGGCVLGIIWLVRALFIVSAS